jgi:thiopeptide-type bacteriocin biosynthesis protein
MAAPSPNIAVADFFAFRTPLLPRATLDVLSEGLSASRALAAGDELGPALASDLARVEARLRELVCDPAIREALFVASPSLDEAITAWLSQPAAPRARGVAEIVLRYVIRMAARPTPFGLFSGCSTGVTGQTTHLEVAQRASYRRHTRLDMHYLVALAEALQCDPGLRSELVVRPSSGLYEAAGQLRYAEADTDPETRTRSYHLVSVERTPYLDAVLARARNGARPSDLVSTLVECDGGVDPEEAKQYLQDLIDSQVLVSDLEPIISGGEPLDRIVEVLRETTKGLSHAVTLSLTSDALRELDARGLGNEPARYRDVAETLEVLPGQPEMSRLFQVDLYKPSPTAVLGGEPLREIEAAATLLARIAPTVERDELRRFREAFAERYGERMAGPLCERDMVPLALVLDEEAGLGFGPSAESSPLLAGIDLLPDVSPREARFGAREQHLLRGITETIRAGGRTWDLAERDLVALASEPAALPDAFAVLTTLAASSEEALAKGEFRLITPSVSGPSGAVLLGRFCHGDVVLRSAVERHLRVEEALRPKAIFAEIVHLPEGRMGNILARPVLRAYEIVFHGRSGGQAGRQIALRDLYVTLAEGRIVLWSQRLGCEVVPRLTSAHNFARESLGIYRFLCALQRERDGRFDWSWGPLEAASFLPRVTVGRVVLSLARWNISQDELDSLAATTSTDRFLAVQSLRAKRDLPRWVAHIDEDNVLPVDLDNALAVESWARLVKGRASARLHEVLPHADELVAYGPEGAFVHELVVPFTRIASAVHLGTASTAIDSGRTLAARPPAVTPLKRTFPPGSAWLFAKLYTGTATADDVLTRVVAPLVRAARKAGVLERWFFIRYGDPHWHVRVRIRGHPARLGAEVLPMLHAHAAPFVTDGRIWRVELGTYERETERYGGHTGIELAEAIFEADSDAILDVMDRLDPRERADARWRLALRGCHEMIGDLGVADSARMDVIRAARATFTAEHRVDTAFARHLGLRFRDERAALEALLVAPAGGGHPLDAGLRALALRAAHYRTPIAELRACELAGKLTSPVRELAASFLHMHCNRMLRASHRTQELVLCDWLLRLYESEEARSRAARVAVVL